jgi:hypothetical protein
MFDGLHITLGKVSQNTPDISCRWMLAGQWWKAEPNGCIAFESERPTVDDRWMACVTEVKYASSVSPTGYGYQGYPYGQGYGHGFDSPVQRHGHWDDDDYYKSRFGPQGTDEDKTTDTKDATVGKTEAPSAGAGGGSGEGDKQSPSTDSELADGADDAPPIQKLIDKYWSDNGVSSPWQQQALVEICESDLGILEFMESLTQDELDKLLANTEVLNRFLRVASSESFEKFQLVSELGEENEVSKQALEEAIEEIRETNVSS